MNSLFRLSSFALLFLLCTGTFASAGMLITASTKEAGLNDVAYYAYSKGAYRYAEALFLNSLAENPAYERAEANLATLYFERGRYADATRLLQELVVRYPKNPSYHHDLAVNLVEELRRNGNGGVAALDTAIAEYRTAEELSPGFGHAAENVVVLERVKRELYS